MTGCCWRRGRAICWDAAGGGAGRCWHRPVHGDAEAGAGALPGGAIREDGNAGDELSRGARWRDLHGRDGTRQPGRLSGHPAQIPKGVEAGVLYFAMDRADKSNLEEAYREAQAQGLPVVFGEMDRPGGNDD